MHADTAHEEIQTWVKGKALPFWQETGVDRSFGGFIEELTLGGQDAALSHKRTRVTCRQMYVYAHAHILGWSDGADLIAHGADFLIDKAWQGNDSGFARRVTREGDCLDGTVDLYDHAFALFAFAWAYRATGDAAYKDWAARTLDFIQSRLQHPGGEGYWHEAPPKGWRLQNPHMHLLEASLVAYEATRDVRYREQASALVDLFKSRFFSRQTGVLAEHFDDNWSVVSGASGQCVEPGHQLEWAWILQQYERLIGSKFTTEITGLVRFAEKHGINPVTGAVVNAVKSDGQAIDAGSRTWPNTERIKAHVALCRLGLSDDMVPIEATARVLMETYLRPTSAPKIPEGTWIDAIDAAGNPIAERIPSSTFYHLFLAIAEVHELVHGTSNATSFSGVQSDVK